MIVVVSILVGLGVGILSGLLGIGGGTIMVPTFKLGYALSAIASTATSLFTIIPTAISGSITHIRNKTCIPKLGVALGVGGAITSPLGAYLANISPDWAIMLAAACVIAYSSYTMLKKALKAKPAGGGAAEPAGGGAAQRAARGSQPAAEPARDGSQPAARGASQRAARGSQPAAEPARDGSQPAARGATKPAPAAAADDSEGFAVTGRTFAICVLIGMLAGVMSGYVGVGGGFIMVPLMMQILNLPMKKTSGTSLIAIMILAIPGVITQAIAGNVDWVVGIFVALGTVPGAAIGAKLVKRVPERTLRFVFSGMLFLAAVALVVNQVV